MPLIAMDGDFDTLPLETFAVSELEQDRVVLQSIDAEDEIIGPVPDGKGQSSGLVDGAGQSRTTTVSIAPFSVRGGTVIQVPIDFPASSFF